MPQLMLNRQPMAFGAVWDEENDAYFYLAPRNPKKPFLTREKPKRFTADPFFGTHVINAYEVPEEVNSKNKIPSYPIFLIMDSNCAIRDTKIYFFVIFF